MTIFRFVELCDGATPTAEGWIAQCPLNRKHALSIISGTKVNVLARCSGGCNFSAIVAALRTREARQAAEKVGRLDEAPEVSR